MSYAVAALQLAVTGGDPEGMARRVAGEVRRLAREVPGLALVLLPEHALAGYEAARDGAGEEALAFQGPGWAVLAAVARETGCWIAGAEPAMTLAGQATLGFLMDPSGEIVLRQQKHTPDLAWGGGAGTTAPLAAGPRGFPVARTPLGTIGIAPGEDILLAEYVRGLGLNGAEVILNPCSERADDRSEARRHSRHARGWENLAWILSATAGAVQAADGTPLAVAAGGSALVDHNGHLVAEAPAGITTLTAQIDLEVSRQRRMDPMANLPAQLRTRLYAGEYEQPDPAAEVPAGSGRLAVARAEERIRAWEAAGVLPPADTAPPPYEVLMVQANITTCSRVEDRDAVIGGNLERSLALAAGMARNPKVKLVVFPEYWLQGAAFGKSVDDFWPVVGIRVPGPEIGRLGQFARECGVYVAGAVFEYDPEWPRRWFNCAFILDPRGELILKYRKIQCGDMQGMLNDTTPGSVYSAYVARYGRDGLFPVVDTPIGRLSATVCFDNNFPELWRTLALRGAEVICYPTGEPHNIRRTAWEHTKRAHAWENLLYIVSANAGSEQRVPGGNQSFFHRGYSRLVAFDGSIQVQADGPGEVPLVGVIDIGAQRRARRNAWRNLVALLETDLVAPVYRSVEGYPLDCFLETPMEDAREGLAFTVATIERYVASGIYTPPGAVGAPVRPPATFVGS